jgi:hypothetical protein
MPIEDLIRELRARGLAVEDAPRRVDGTEYVVIDPYPIEMGPHAGKVVAIALATPLDFPISPPGGIHVKPHLIPVGTRNTGASSLGSEWQYWSRPISDWRRDRSVARLLSHVNRLMMDA